MLKKLFGSKKVPTNEGNEAPVSRGLGPAGLAVVKVFELELSNMEGTPVYALTHQLTIGSEIGNIVISDPSISPRHATFILQQEVISLVDHGSVTGTLVNGKKIPPGRYIILEETDVINIGDLEIRILCRNVTAPTEEIPDLPTEEVIEEDEEEKTENSEAIDEVNSDSAEEGEVEHLDEAPPVLPTQDKRAANALIRVVAVCCDLLLAYGILVVLMPFDEFRMFLESVPETLSEIIGVDFYAFSQALSEDLGFIVEMVEGVFSFLAGTFHFGPLFLVFISLRLISTLILGVSLSEFLLFIRARKNPLWARVGGALRVLVGIITGPFLVFDAPAIISRRTFKEILTYTHLQVSSKFLAILGALLVLPLSLSFALLSPIFQGLDLTEPISVNDKIEQRIKVAPTEGTETTPVILTSKFFNLELQLESDAQTIMPMFKFQGAQKKLNFTPKAVFYSREQQRPVTLELLKTFDMKQLLAIGIKGNFFLYDKYPQIYSFVYEASVNPSFKGRSDNKSEFQFGTEFMAFSDFAFELSAGNAFDAMETQTFLLKGPLDFKNSLLGLIEYKDFDQVGFIKLGNVLFMKFSYLKRRPFDLIIPLVKGQGRIFRVEFDKFENLKTISSSFYKYTLERANWLQTAEAQPIETLDSLKVIDILSSLNKNKDLSSEDAQAVYGHFYETSAEVLKRGDNIEIDLWKKSVQSTFKVIEGFTQGAPSVPEEMNPMQKLFQNFRDLSDALENRNMEYFGVTETTTI